MGERIWMPFERRCLLCPLAVEHRFDGRAGIEHGLARHPQQRGDGAGPHTRSHDMHPGRK